MIQTFSKQSHIEKKSELNGYFEKTMKTSKRDVRKPELAIYRPGMGLQNKSSKNEDKCDQKLQKSGSPSNYSILEQLSVQSNNEDQTSNNEISKSSKNTKNRRPDIQVYTPKPKIAAQLNNKKSDIKNGSQPPAISETTPISKGKKSPVSNLKENSDGEGNTSSKRSHSKSANQSIPAKQITSNSPLLLESWGDVDDSDISNSRSSPDKLCNGKAHHTHKNDEKPKRKHNTKQKCNNEEKKLSSIHNAKKNDHYTSSNTNSSEIAKEKLEKSQFSNDNLRVKQKCIDLDSRITEERSEIFLKEEKRDLAHNRNGKKRCEQNLPPRFQKNKKQGQENHSNSASKFNSSLIGSGGILKLPADFDRSVNLSEPAENSIYIPKIFQERPVFIHKTLFDPNNPNKPEIVNIPAPHPPPHLPYSNINNEYYSSESSYVTQPIHNIGYIPPPQPPVISRPYYGITDIQMNVIPDNYLSRRDIIPAPVPNPAYCHPSMSYPEMPPVLPEVGKRSRQQIKEIKIDSSLEIAGNAESLNTETDTLSYDWSSLSSCSSVSIANEDYVPIYIDQQFYHWSQNTTPSNFNCYSNDIYDESPITPEPDEGIKPLVENYLKEISLREKELSTLLPKGLDDETFDLIQCCRSQIEVCYEKIILADPTYCAERNPEQSLWRTTFHQIIELCRKKLEETTSDRASIKEKLLTVINQGSYFFLHLIEGMEEKYEFDVVKLLESDTIINMSLVPERVRVVLISVQKLHVYLGDLARYKEQVNQTSNYGKARSYYQKASQILPKNGRPYYQLALVSISTRRKLDAVYYYIRSLTASNPILSAKESLLTLFEEVKRKYELYEKKRIQESPNESESLDQSIGKRIEVWIKLDGSSNQRPAEMDQTLDSADVKNLSDSELNKRFVTSFLHVHGKLFTKVGMETFPATLNQMLKEFYFLLQRTPLPITSSRLMQLIAINIYSVDNSSSKENGREHGEFSLLQEQALYASMAMMSILMERCHMLYIAHKSSPDFSNHVISDDLGELLPSVKIWTDWMSCQKSFWAPPPRSVLKELNVGFAKNIWLSFADLLTILREMDVKYPETSNTPNEDYEILILEEDNSFAGFVPLLSALQDPIYLRRPFDKISTKHAVRINRIQFFGDYLCGITPPCMEFDVENKKFISLVDKIYSEESFERSVLHNSWFDEVIREEDIDNNFRGRAFHENDKNNELQILWSKKEALSKTKEQQEKYKAEVQAVLQKHQSQRSIVLKIKPKYLIPDTNCFIDHLRLFRNILALSSYNLIVPLVVINELDGLARGTRVNEHTSPEHANRVTILSREAICFLEEQFAQKNPHIKAITSKGSILDTISFRSEEMGKNKGTNDDLILSCCLFYCKDRPGEFMPKNSNDPVTLFREVVLLTDDRNLRVKALAHHVPVRDLQSFLQWVNS